MDIILHAIQAISLIICGIIIYKALEANNGKR